MRIAKCGLGSGLIGDWCLADKLAACGFPITAFVPTFVGQIHVVARGQGCGSFSWNSSQPRVCRNFSN